MAFRIYRIARSLYLRRLPLLQALLMAVDRIVFAVVLPPSTDLGRKVLLKYNDLRAVLRNRAVLGAGAVVGAGLTIGRRGGHAQVPVIGDGAMIGASVKVQEPVDIGRYASIGANAVVLCDIPDYGFVVGVPARVVRISQATDIADHRSFER